MINILRVATLAVLAAAPVSAATLVESTTFGAYNAGIGTLLDSSNPFGGSFMFPPANVSGGDPSLDIPASSPPDLSAAATPLGSWLTTPAAPGGSWSAPMAIPSSWAVNSETAIIYAIDGGASGYQNVTAGFGVDNGVFVWLNGAFLGGHLRSGGATAGEFVLDLATLGAGTSYLQILREDHGGGTGWVVDVTGDAVTAAVVPVPASGLLLLAGLGVLALRRKR